MKFKSVEEITSTLLPTATAMGIEIVEVEAKIHASNVMLIDPKTNKVTRKKAVSAKKTATYVLQKTNVEGAVGEGILMLKEMGLL